MLLQVLPLAVTDNTILAGIPTRHLLLFITENLPVQHRGVIIYSNCFCKHQLLYCADILFAYSFQTTGQQHSENFFQLFVWKSICPASIL